MNQKKKPPKGRNYPFAQRGSAFWEKCHVTFDQAVDMFYDQTATQQYLGHDPIVNSLVYKGVKYSTILEAQRVYTQDQNSFYEKKEQEQLAQEARGIKAFKNMNDAVRKRLNPTENGLMNVAERPLKPMGETSSMSTLKNLLSSSSKSSVDNEFIENVYSNGSGSEFPLYSQTQPAEKILSDSLALECSLKDEMEKNKQHVVIADLEDAHKILHNVWLESGKDVAALAASINSVKSWANHTESMFNARQIAKEFGDMGVKADLVQSKGKLFVAFSGTDKNGKVLKHAFVNGTRINMNGKKYPLNSFKSMQAGFSPRSRAANFKGAALLTFVVSASIATTDIIFKDDYHLTDWFGHVGSDMFKALIQNVAGEAALFVSALVGAPILAGAVVAVVCYVVIEVVWGEYEIADQIVAGIENVVE